MSQVHPSRHSLVPQSQSQSQSHPPRKHKHKRNPPTTVAEASTAAPSSISHLRRKIRDLTRLLSRSRSTASKDGNSTLPPAAIIQTERALASYKRDLALLQQSTKEKKLNERYRMVRFFERQKSTRHLKKLTRQSPPASPTKLLAARLNLNYTLYYPPHRKYISLYRDCSSDPKTQCAKEEILNDIKWRMEEGMLGKWTVNAERDNDFVINEEKELEAGGGVQLGRHDAEEEEKNESSKQRKTDKNDKEDKGKKHKGKSNKSSKGKSKSKSKQRHGMDEQQEKQQPAAAGTGGFFEF